jgi:tyrosine-protein phosphatase SIW14
MCARTRNGPAPGYIYGFEPMQLTPGFASLRRVSLIAPVLLLTFSAFGQDAAGVPNFHKVNDKVYRGAQPSTEGFQSLAKLGVKTVIDLREADGRAAAEKRTVEGIGMRYVNVPMLGMHTPNPADVAKVLAMFEDKNGGPVFVHCRRGADRTGTVVACYRISHDHWENQKALGEAKSFGMAWIQKAMQHYVMGYRPPVQNADAAAAVTGMN